MYKKIILIFVGFFLFFGNSVAQASISINEVMYNSEGSDIDWVEIYNGDSGNVDLTTQYLLISNSTSNHGINKYSGSSLINQGDYGIIVPTSQIEAFIAKWGDSGNLFTSSFSLPNVTGEEIAKVEINDGDKNSPKSSLSYKATMGADGDGNSLQLINGSWKPAIPTPKVQNYVAAPISAQTNTSTNSSNVAISNITIPVIAKNTEIPTIKAKIITKGLVLAGIPLEFKSNITGYSGEMLRYGKIFWNFGDGDSKEQINNFDKFSHIYSYPGEYTVSLEYYTNYFLENSDAISKMTIKVLPESVIISKVGNEKDFFIELTNNSDYEIDISGWVLSSLDKRFSLPKNTVMIGGSKIILSPKITNFTIGDEKNLKLMTLTGENIFDYGSSVVEKNIIVTNNIKKPVLPVAIRIGNREEPLNLNEAKTLSLGDDLSANVIDNVTLSKSNTPLFFGGFIILLVIAAGAVYFIRRNKVPAIEGDDFEILDE